MLRAARGQASDPRGSAIRNYNAPFTAPVLRGSSSARTPRAANASLSPRTAIPLGIALFALSLQQFTASGDAIELAKMQLP